MIFGVDEPNTYNLNPTAGSRLGANLTEKTKAKISDAITGISCSAKTKALFSKVVTDRIHSPEILALMSETQKSIDRTSKNNSFYAKTHSAEIIAKMSTILGIAIFVYNSQGLLVNTFSSAKKLVNFLTVHIQLLLNMSKIKNYFKVNDIYLFPKNFIRKISIKSFNDI